MNTTFDWTKNYIQYLKENLFITQLENGWTEIGIPIWDRHNDGLSIYAKMTENSHVILSDGGYTLHDLQADGILIQTQDQIDQLQSLLFPSGIINQDNELIMYVTKEKYASSLQMFIRTILAVNYYFIQQASLSITWGVKVNEHFYAFSSLNCAEEFFQKWVYKATNGKIDDARFRDEEGRSGDMINEEGYFINDNYYIKMLPCYGFNPDFNDSQKDTD